MPTGTTHTLVKRKSAWTPPTQRTPRQWHSLGTSTETSPTSGSNWNSTAAGGSRKGPCPLPSPSWHSATCPRRNTWASMPADPRCQPPSSAPWKPPGSPPQGRQARRHLQDRQGRQHFLLALPPRRFQGRPDTRRRQGLPEHATGGCRVPPRLPSPRMQPGTASPRPGRRSQLHAGTQDPGSIAQPGQSRNAANTAPQTGTELRDTTLAFPNDAHASAQPGFTTAPEAPLSKSTQIR